MEQTVTGVLSTLAGDGNKVIPIRNGESSTRIHVMNGRTVPKVLRVIAAVAKELNLSLSDAEEVQARLLSKMTDIGFILQLIANYSGQLYELVADMTDLANVQEVEELEIDDIVKLIVAVVEVNRDFFMRRVLPTLNALTKSPSKTES